MNVFKFMSDSPILTFFLFIIVGSVIKGSIDSICRHRTIQKHGYPPEHCDSDGQFKEVPEEEEE